MAHFVMVWVTQVWEGFFDIPARDWMSRFMENLDVYFVTIVEYNLNYNWLRALEKDDCTSNEDIWLDN